MMRLGLRHKHKSSSAGHPLASSICAGGDQGDRRVVMTSRDSVIAQNSSQHPPTGPDRKRDGDVRASICRLAP
jgi:hypothetical protein